MNFWSRGEQAEELADNWFGGDQADGEAVFCLEEAYSHSSTDTRPFGWIGATRKILSGEVLSVEVVGLRSVTREIELLQEMGLEVGRVVELLSISGKKCLIKVAGRAIGIDRLLARDVLVRLA